jgi:hypothetical protein
VRSGAIVRGEICSPHIVHNPAEGIASLEYKDVDPMRRVGRLDTEINMGVSNEPMREKISRTQTLEMRMLCGRVKYGLEGGRGEKTARSMERFSPLSSPYPGMRIKLIVTKVY